MIVCITEKPSVAKDIAAILGATVKREGYYEGDKYWVTWTFGHLCMLKEPQDYTDKWKVWSLGALPMIPPKFGIRLIPNKGIEKQFQVIKKLIGEADEVINCGDAGQEGELIQRWVMQKAECRKPVKRLWISSLTDESIKEGFTALRSEADFDSLYYAGLSRAIGDWILGMNATRLFTLKYAQNRGVLSVGRVQTPTLALIVARQREIENFVPEDFWEVRTLYRNVIFNSSLGRFEKEADALEVVTSLKNKLLKIKDIKTKRSKEAPPKLFDLTSLQVECNKKYGFSAEETLRYIQSLYEKKFTTYPRVDTTYLSDDIYPKVPGILSALTPYRNYTATLLTKKLPKTKRVFDNSKVTDHHAIIPTNVPPSSLLPVAEKKVYDMIARRFIAAFYPESEIDQTTVKAEVENVEFKATGKQIVVDGWRAVFSTGTKATDSTSEETTEGILPQFEVGEFGQHEPSVIKKTTQPPKYYTEGTLLRAMETAGKLVDDDELRDAMKENGIGRPSTRAQIIETLFKRRYIVKEKKNLKATPAGIALIDTIKIELLKSAKLTGIWENKLRKIEKKEYDAGQFIRELKELISQIVVSVLSDNSGNTITLSQQAKNSDLSQIVSQGAGKKERKRAVAIKSLEQIVCPVCGTGHIIKGQQAYGCSNYKSGCSFRINFTDCPETLTPLQVNKKIKTKYGNKRG